MQIANAVVIILSEYGTKEVHKRETIWFSSWNNINTSCDGKGLRGRKLRKNGWEPGMLRRSRRRRIGQLSSPLNRMTRVFSEKIQKRPLRAPKSFLWSWLKFIFFIFSPSRVIATCTPVPTWVPKKMPQTGAHQLERATPILSLCSL